MGRQQKKPKRGSPEKPEGYRKPFKQARISLRLAAAAEQAAERLDQDFTQYVKDALRMRLEAEGFWPPTDAKS